jgi:hypothetical protein
MPGAAALRFRIRQSRQWQAYTISGLSALTRKVTYSPNLVADSGTSGGFEGIWLLAQAKGPDQVIG